MAARAIARLALVAEVLCRAQAFSNYQIQIPNGQSVVRNGADWQGVGHVSSFGGGARNAFGQAFAAAGRTWTWILGPRVASVASCGT